jgi:hypothetical protein
MPTNNQPARTTPIKERIYQVPTPESQPKGRKIYTKDLGQIYVTPVRQFFLERQNDKSFKLTHTK